MTEKHQEKRIREIFEKPHLPEVSDQQWGGIWEKIEGSRKIITRPVIPWRVVAVGMAATFFLGLGLGLGVARFSNPGLNQNTTPVQPTDSRPAAKVTVPQKPVRLTSESSPDEEEGIHLLGLRDIRVQETDSPHQYKLVGKTQRGIPVIWSYTRETANNREEGEQS
jgi:hypothetical protein